VTREEAIEAARRGGYAAFVAAGLSTLIMAIAISFDIKDGVLGYMNDPFTVVDILLVVICGVGILRRSRVAAVAMFVEFVGGQIDFVVKTGRVPGVLAGLIFLYFFGRAVQGTFCFHKIERKENPEYKGAPLWTYVVGWLAAGLAAVVVVLLALQEIGVLADGRVVSGADLPRRQYEQLVASGIISNDEIVEFFYSETIFSVVAAGEVLTNRRVITYLTDDSGQLQIAYLPFSEIASVELVDAGGELSDSVYLVSSFDDDRSLQVVLSTGEGRDQAFVEALRAKLQRRDEPLPGGL